MRLTGPDGTEIEAVRWIHEGKRVRRWIEKENALLGRLAKDAPQVSWVADGERERALAEFLDEVAAHADDCDGPGRFWLYRCGNRPAVVFEER